MFALRNTLLFAVLAVGALAAPSFAQDGAGVAEALATAEKAVAGVDFVWTLVAAFLVFFMQAGFAMVETGFTRAKNAGNIMMKNLMDFSFGTISFWLVGFGIMFGVSTNGFFGTSDFMPTIGEDQWSMAFLIFQTVFAATAATIVSGAVAERTKFIGYIIYSIFITLLVYPLFGHWAWGNLFHGDSASWLAGHGLRRLRRLHRRPLDRWLGGPRRRHRARSPDRQV